MTLSNVVHPPSRIVSHLKEKKFPDLYSLIRPPGRQLTLVSGGNHIPGFIQSHPTLCRQGFIPFIEDENQMHFSNPSGTFRESLINIDNKFVESERNRDKYNFNRNVPLVKKKCLKVKIIVISCK